MDESSISLCSIYKLALQVWAKLEKRMVEMESRNGESSMIYNGFFIKVVATFPKRKGFIEEGE